MREVIPLNDNVLIRMKNKPDEVITKTGLYIAGVEQDYYIAEVIAVGPGIWRYNKKGKEIFIPTEVEPGDIVVLEKDFYHIYDWKNRNRVEDTIRVDKSDDKEYTYYLTKSKDIYFEFDSWEEAESLDLYGELYSVMEVKPSVNRVSY